jgi:hypothetical protein
MRTSVQRPRTEICLVDQLSDLCSIELWAIRKMEGLRAIITPIETTKGISFGSQIIFQLPAAAHGAARVTGVLGTTTQLAAILQVALSVKRIGEFLQY